jgi:hypothetical protein
MTTAYQITLTGTGVAGGDAQDAYEAAVASLWGDTDAISAGGATPQGSLRHEAITTEEAEGLTPDTWAAATAYGIGAVITATTPNGHFYRALTAGTSHASVEPTWVTNGGTNSDGSTGLVWRDQGLLAAAESTEYAISIAGRGVSSANATSAFETMVLALRAATDVGAQEPTGSLQHTDASDEDAGDV